MAKYDKNDFFKRLKALLPAGWFGDSSPVLSGALSACAQSLAWCYSLYVYARKQTRISTASRGWLDMAAYDFFSNSLRRPAGMSDEQFRHQIQISLLRERGTRQAMVDILEDLTGNTPVIVEPQRPMDTGAYGVPSAGYGVAGRYGSMLLFNQAFVTVHRPLRAGVPWVAGYRVSTAGYSQPSQGEYVSQEMVGGNLTDEQIYAAVAAVKMEGTLVWVHLQ